MDRQKLITALSKSDPTDWEDHGDDTFDPWRDIIEGISGGYSSESDDLMIAVMRAVLDRTTFELIENMGFQSEFALYVLAGHDLLNYGTSPRGGWPEESIADLWDQLILKWTNYAHAMWSE